MSEQRPRVITVDINPDMSMCIMDFDRERSWMFDADEDLVDSDERVVSISKFLDGDRAGKENMAKSLKKIRMMGSDCGLRKLALGYDPSTGQYTVQLPANTLPLCQRDCNNR